MRKSRQTKAAGGPRAQELERAGQRIIKTFGPIPEGALRWFLHFSDELDLATLGAGEWLTVADELHAAVGLAVVGQATVYAIEQPLTRAEVTGYRRKVREDIFDPLLEGKEVPTLRPKGGTYRMNIPRDAKGDVVPGGHV